MENYKERAVSTATVVAAVKSLDASVLTDWYDVLFRFLSAGKSFYILLAACVGLVYAGMMNGMDAMQMGYRHAYGVTREIPWGILISTYIFFVVTSTGLCIVSSIGHVFGVKAFMPIAKRAVYLSIATIMAGFMVLFFDLENPFNSIYNLLSPNPTSNIWWMGTLYGAYMLFMIVELLFLLIGNHKIAMYAGLLGLLSGLAAHSNLGAIFGMLHGREYWYGPYLPIYFIVSATMMGSATIIFFTWIGNKINNGVMDKYMEQAMGAIARLCTLMIAAIMFFTTWKIITGFVGGSGKTEAIFAFLTGPYAFNFWVIEVTIGMVIPFILFLASRGKNLNMMFVASAMMIFSIFFMRYDMVMGGLIVPQYHELGVNEYSGLLSYMPTYYEFMVVLGGMGFLGMTFLLGEKVFEGHKSEIH